MEYRVITQRHVPFELDDNTSGAKLIVLIDQLLNKKGVYSDPDCLAKGMQSLLDFSGASGATPDLVQDFERNIEGLDDTLEWFCANQGLLAIRSLSAYLHENPSLGNFSEVQEWIQATALKLEACAKEDVRWHLEVITPDEGVSAQSSVLDTAKRMMSTHTAEHKDTFMETT